MSETGDAQLVKGKFREIYSRHQTYNAFSFNEFLSEVTSAKNLLTRYVKGTLGIGEGGLINTIVCIANAVGPDSCQIFETPLIVEKQYSVIRAILHHMGLPYSPGQLHPGMNAYLQTLDYKVRFYSV